MLLIGHNAWPCTTKPHVDVLIHNPLVHVEPYLQSPSWRRRLCDLDEDLEDDLDMHTARKPKPYVGHVDNNVHRHQPTREVWDFIVLSASMFTTCQALEPLASISTILIDHSYIMLSQLLVPHAQDERYLVSAARRRFLANLNKDGKDALDTQDVPSPLSTARPYHRAASNKDTLEDLEMQDAPALPSSAGRSRLTRSNVDIGDDLAKQVTHPLRDHVAPSSSHRPSSMYCLCGTPTNAANNQDHAHLLSGARRRLLSNLNNSTLKEHDAQMSPIFTHDK
ncbi:hypothetical protein HaLaN_14313 [Haematococcus lacustris]|uniref:Uncharacterized protein n=1 Tax=Haematococcus lacustris TaxID=44745 RepID=A0A699ZFK9_HAELA|nr:hypothetical protein HaLaN_14313 [Haematococcus lacustris]